MKRQTQWNLIIPVVAMLIPGLALAQGEAASAPPPSSEPAPAPDAAPPAPDTAAPAPNAEAEAPSPGRLDNNRFRFGLELGAGPVLGDQVGAALGVILQLGVQFGELWHLYYQPSLYVAGFGDTSGSASGDAFVATVQGAMFGLTIKQFLELGIGGGALIGWVGACDSATETCTGGSEHIPMLNARLAFVIGFKLGHSRLGIPIGAHLQTLFDDSTNVSTLIFTVGIQRY